MMPRVLRPAKAAPKFTTLGYTRLWASTAKTGAVSGSAYSDSGQYSVRWWDGSVESFNSGATFSKSGSGVRAFDLYPSITTGTSLTPSGQFDGFNVSGNLITKLRAESVSLSSTAGYNQKNWNKTYGNQFTYVPGVMEQGNVSSNLLDAAALDQFYTDLSSGSGALYVAGNPGITSDTPTIATAKGYTVYGSTPPSTALLLNFSGSNGSTTFTDLSPNASTVTASGAVISTSQSRFGNSSGYFAGGANRLTIPDSLGFTANDDFTVEAWIRPTQWNSGFELNAFILQADNFDNNNNRSWGLFVYDGSAGFYYTRDGVTDRTFACNATVPLNEWTHMAVSIEGTTLRVFINGQLVGTSSVHMPIFNSSADLCIGTFGKYAEDGYEGLSFTGYIDDLRIVTGKAIYTANFTPPTSQLTVLYP